MWYHPVHQVCDGYITANIGPDFRAWENVCAAMNRLDLLKDARFCTQQKVHENLPAATEIVRDWLADLTGDEAIAALTEHHIACGMVYTVDQAVRQPQVQARELVVDVDDPLLGRIEVINSAFRYKNATSGVRGPAPLLGAHNVEMLEHLLGYTPERIQALQESGVLRAENL